MRQLNALIWKECRETQVFLWIAWFLFIVLPVIGAVEQYLSVSHRFEFLASPWVLMLGPVMAIVVGVAVTCRDVQPKLEDFWQSRPIGGTRLFVVKYFVALAVIMLSCSVPLLIEIGLRQKNSIDLQSLWFAAVWLAAFSIAFAVGCVVRRTAHAAAISVVGVLLLFFLPVIVPPLGRFAISQIGDWISSPVRTGVAAYLPELVFAAGMCAVAGVFDVVALLAVRFYWHVESSKPLIYGAISSAFLILITSASYQLGTNLPILEHVALPHGEVAGAFWLGAPRNIIYTRSWLPDSNQKTRERTLKFTPSGMEFGPSVVASRYLSWVGASDFMTRSTADSMIGYVVGAKKVDDENYIQQLLVVGLGADSVFDPPRIDLWPTPREPRSQINAEPFLYVSNNLLYVVGLRTITFDISDPTHPKRLTDQPLQWHPRWRTEGLHDSVVDLPPAPGLSARERLKFAISTENRFGLNLGFDGTIWCEAERANTTGTLVMSRLKSLDDTRATFSLVATYKPTLVQMLTATTQYTNLSMRDGLLYAMSARGFLSVFDLRGPRPMSLIAHFASSENLQACRPLDGGRVLVGGDQLWLLGPPPRH